MSEKITLEIKLQNIYFQDKKNELGIFHTGEKERLTINKAKEILEENEIEFQSIFQVRKENVEIELSTVQLENLIKK